MARQRLLLEHSLVIVWSLQLTGRRPLMPLEQRNRPEQHTSCQAALRRAACGRNVRVSTATHTLTNALNDLTRYLDDLATTSLLCQSIALLSDAASCATAKRHAALPGCHAVSRVAHGLASQPPHL